MIDIPVPGAASCGVPSIPSAAVRRLQERQTPKESGRGYELHKGVDHAGLTGLIGVLMLGTLGIVSW
jgi:hypothetical protein